MRVKAGGGAMLKHESHANRPAVNQRLVPGQLLGIKTHPLDYY